MSVDHKVFVCCSKDKALEVYGAVYSAIRDFTRAKAEIFTSNFNHFWLSFVTAKESRDIFMTHSCSYDYKEIYDGEKIIFSIGHWGDHQIYMDIIKDAIKDFGDVYEDVNDCDDIDFEKVN